LIDKNFGRKMTALKFISASDNNEILKENLLKQFPSDLAELIQSKSPNEQKMIFSILPEELAVQTFEHLSFPSQKIVLSILPSEKVAYLLNHLAPDDRTGFLEDLPPKIVNQLIKLLSPEERVLTLKLLGYPEDSVGRLMTPDYLAIHKDWTVQQVLDYVRAHGHDSETIEVIYVVDDKGVLLDDLRIREFLFAPLDAKVSDLMDHRFIALSAYDNEEDAIQIFRKYDRTALPVVDKEGILIGIVTFDDILELVDEEDTEDIQKIGGMEALEEPYMQTSFLSLIQKRGGWLIILFLGEMLTATALGYYQDEISKAVVLALFLPLIISSGGNSGSQATTLIIRAMALGEVKLRDWWRVMRREIFAGLALGCLLGIIGFLRVSTWSIFTDMYGPHWFLIALTVCFSLIGVVLWGTISGSMLPFILKRFGLDPATCSAPFVATLVDVTGVVIYFTIALMLLRGTLL
jgi:magnesium transporter